MKNKNKNKNLVIWKSNRLELIRCEDPHLDKALNWALKGENEAAILRGEPSLACAKRLDLVTEKAVAHMAGV